MLSTQMKYLYYEEMILDIFNKKTSNVILWATFFCHTVRLEGKIEVHLKEFPHSSVCDWSVFEKKNGRDKGRGIAFKPRNKGKFQ